MTPPNPGSGSPVAIGWASLAMSVARCLQDVEKRVGTRVRLVELRPALGRTVNLKVGIGETVREAHTIEVNDLSPEEAVRAVPHVIAFLDAAASRPQRLRAKSRITSNRRPSREARRTSEPSLQRRQR